MPPALVTSTAGQLAVLCGVASFFFWLERRTACTLFRYVPPLAWIYLTPLALSNFSLVRGRPLLPTRAPLYEALSALVLPMLLVLLLLNVDLASAFRLFGRGMAVMLCGSLGVVLGAPLGLWIVRHRLEPDAWKAFGALSGSWVGGTGNMAAVGEMVGAGGTEMGLAVLADTTCYLIWLPLLLASKGLAGRFARCRPPSAAAAAEPTEEPPPPPATLPAMADYLALAAVAAAAAWGAEAAAPLLPVREPYLAGSSWRILLVTTFGLALSFSPARRIPGSQPLAMALLYLFVAKMGASAALDRAVEQAAPFLVGAAICLAVHGCCCLAAAWLLRVDLPTAAIASAANIGGAASAPIVALHHRPALVPASVLMALVGYAVGNYAGYVAALLCRAVQ
jgi:uncharacterized membrane protein